MLETTIDHARSSAAPISFNLFIGGAAQIGLFGPGRGMCSGVNATTSTAIGGSAGRKLGVKKRMKKST